MCLKLSQKILALVFVFLLFISPAHTAIDNCLVGKWTPEPAQLKQQFEYLTKQKISRTGGQLSMNLDNSGKGLYQINDFSMVMAPPVNGAGETTIVMNGSSNFNWTSANSKFAMNSGKFLIKTSGWLQMGGTRIPLPAIPFSDSQWTTGFADGSYRCSGNKLLFLLESKVKLLKVWNRM